LLLSPPLFFVARLVDLESLAHFGDRLSVMALGAWSFWSLRRAACPGAGAARHGRNPLLIGLVHDIGGAGSLMLFLPALVAGSTAQSALFLLPFAFGSTLAMSALTSTVARVGGRLARAALPSAERDAVRGRRRGALGAPSADLSRACSLNNPHISLDAFECPTPRSSASVTKIAAQSRLAQPSANDLFQNAFALDTCPEARVASRSGASKTRV
jgi:hypothetical protein